MEENQLKTEEEIKQEAKQEFEEEIKQKEKKKLEKKNHIKGIIHFLYRIIVIILLLFIIFETAMGILDMDRLNKEEEPFWYLNSKVEEKENVKVTTYNLGLYVIEKQEEGTKIKIVLRPFF